MEIVKAQQTAIVQRTNLNKPEIMQHLNNADAAIIRATDNRRISEMSDDEISQDLRVKFRFICIDIGYRIPEDKELWAYMQTRIFTIIRQYYGNLTTAEIKLAFELAAVGELDDYLPRDAQGNPDAKHYQQFNAEYVGKILRAFIKRKGIAVTNAYEIDTPKVAAPNQDDCPFIDIWAFVAVYTSFNIYKYRGKTRAQPLMLKVIYDWLLSRGLAEDATITQDDRHRAWMEARGLKARGLINEYDFARIAINGENSKELTADAWQFARNRAIKEAFRYIEREEIDLKTYL